MRGIKTWGALVLAAVYVLAIAFADKKITVGSDTVAASSSWVSDKSLPVVVLDAGHGGMDGGCVSYNGVSEKVVNLNITLALRAMLEVYGYEVVLTRDSDKSIHDDGVTGLSAQKKSDMKNRLEIINSNENAIAVSIHQNQFTDPAYSGAQMFYSETNPDSMRLAQSLQQAFVENLQPENKREIKLTGKDLYLIYYAEIPSVMVECGFLSNPAEADLLLTEEYQKKVAFTIFKGINSYLGKA